MLHVMSAQGPMHPSTTAFTWNGKGDGRGHKAMRELEAPCGWLGMQVAQEFPLHDPSFRRDKVREKEVWKGKGPGPKEVTDLFTSHNTAVFEKPEMCTPS